MSIRIGRFAAPRTDSVSISGRQVRVGGSFQATNSAAAIAARQRIAGYVDNPDETIVPVTWDKDPTVDGYYRVVDADVTLDQQRSYQTNAGFHYNWSAVLEQVEGYQAPVMETVIGGVLRSNAHSIASNDIRTWHALPQNESYAVARAPFQPARHETGPAADGSTVYKRQLYHFGDAPSYQLFTNDVSTYYVSPDNWYDASCSVSIDGEKVVGRQIVNDPQGLVLGNELIRFSVRATSTIRVEVYDGSQWEPIDFVLLAGNLSGPTLTTNPPSMVTVLRNSPEVCSVRYGLPLDLPVGQHGSPAATLDVSLRRGARWFECLLAQPDIGAVYQGIKPAVAEQAAPITGGIRATNYNSASNQYVLATPLAFSSSNDTGRIYNTDNYAPEFPFMIGIHRWEDRAGVHTGNPYTAQVEILEYMVTGTEIQTVQTR